MKLAYIVCSYKTIKTNAPGIAKKIMNHVNYFNKNNINTDLIDFPYVETLQRFRVDARILPFFPDAIQWNPSSLIKYDAIYIRKNFHISSQLINFIKNFKKINPKAKVLFEIPTFPYDKEYKGLWGAPLLIKDRHHRNKISKYIDRIVSVAKCDSIFNCKTIYMPNGIDVNKIKARQPSSDYNKKINIICVASFAEWHGYDRLIEGLALYYKNGGKRNITIHMVGGGNLTTHYRKIISHHQLDKNFVFYGPLYGKELDKIYNLCNYACGSLGAHRIGLHCLSTLKSREYLAKGIPFIYSGEIDVFETNKQDFCFQATSDEAPINIFKFVKFYDNLYSKYTELELINKIRNYAKKTVDIQITMKEVVNYLVN